MVVPDALDEIGLVEKTGCRNVSLDLLAVVALFRGQRLVPLQGLRQENELGLNERAGSLIVVPKHHAIVRRGFYH